MLTQAKSFRGGGSSSRLCSISDKNILNGMPLSITLAGRSGLFLANDLAQGRVRSMRPMQLMVRHFLPFNFEKAGP